MKCSLNQVFINKFRLSVPSCQAITSPPFFRVPTPRIEEDVSPPRPQNDQSPSQKCIIGKSPFFLASVW